MNSRLEIVAQAVTWLAGVATIAALGIEMGGYARQWPGSYRRVTGWMLAGFGVTLAAGAASWLVDAHLTPLRGRGLALTLVGGGGALLSAMGFARRAHAPVDPSVKTLRALAWAVERHVDLLDEAAGFEHRRYLPLTVERDVPVRRGIMPVSRAVLRTRAQFTILTGDSGAGKTVALRQIARQECRNVQAQRQPKRIAVYIDLATLSDGDQPVTADVIRLHIRESIAAGDTALRVYLDKHMREPRDRPEWVFLFDSFDELAAVVNEGAPDAAARRYLDAIHQFLSSAGPSFRAVIATRRPDSAAYIAAPVYRMRPLSARQQRDLGRQAGLTPAVLRGLLRRLRYDPAIVRVARNPLLLQLLCDYTSQGGLEDIPATLDEIVDAAVATRLRSVAGSIPLAAVLAVAEYVAHQLTAEPALKHGWGQENIVAGPTDDGLGAGVDLETAMRVLVAARIGRVDKPNAFTFTHRMLQDYFAARWFLCARYRFDTQAVLTDPRWKESASILLRIGPNELRRDVVMAAAHVLADETSRADGIVEHVAPLTDINRQEPLPLPRTLFTWPPTALHVLQVLVVGLRSRRDAFPAELQHDADRLVVSSFAAGMLLDQKRAIEISAAASAEVAQWAVERAVQSGSFLLEAAAAHQVASAPDVFARLHTRPRVEVTRAAALNSELVDEALRTGDAGRTPIGPTLTETLRNLVRTGQVAAAAIGIVNIPPLIAELRAHPHQVFSAKPNHAALILMSALFLGTWTGRRRGPASLANAAAILLILVTLLGAVVGLLTLIAAGALLVTESFGTAARDVISAYLLTWPLAMATFIAVGPPPTPQDWLLPQYSVTRMGAGAVPASWHRMYAALIRFVRSSVIAATVIGIVIFADGTPLPMVKARDRDTVRGFLLLILIAALVAAKFAYGRWRLYIQRRTVTGRLGAKDVTGSGILEWLAEATTRLATERLLKELSAAAPGSLRAAANALTDLARALDHVKRIVPAETTKPIPPGVWDVAPPFVMPDFREWLSRYDRRYPGRLSWLSASHRDKLAQALDRVDA